MILSSNLTKERPVNPVTSAALRYSLTISVEKFVVRNCSTTCKQSVDQDLTLPRSARAMLRAETAAILYMDSTTGHFISLEHALRSSRNHARVSIATRQTAGRVNGLNTRTNACLTKSCADCCCARESHAHRHTTQHRQTTMQLRGTHELPPSVCRSRKPTRPPLNKHSHHKPTAVAEFSHSPRPPQARITSTTSKDVRTRLRHPQKRRSANLLPGLANMLRASFWTSERTA